MYSHQPSRVPRKDVYLEFVRKERNFFDDSEARQFLVKKKRGSLVLVIRVDWGI